MTDEKRFENASVVVQQLNDLSRSKDVFSKIYVPHQSVGKQCPLCLVMNTCLNSSALWASLGVDLDKTPGSYFFDILCCK